MQKDCKQLTSLPFLASLGMLLVNDLFLKAYFHNYMTGKLSDFTGLFVFSIFWSVVLPKAKGYVFFLTALLFIAWKSPYSDGFIVLFSDYIFPVQRVVDSSDLIALAILPLAWRQLAVSRHVSVVNPWIAGALALFSFCATSVPRPVQKFEQPQYILLTSMDFSADP